MPNLEWGEITYPFPNFNGCTVEVWEWISNFIPHYIMDVITYLCLKLIPVSKKGSQVVETIPCRRQRPVILLCQLYVRWWLGSDRCHGIGDIVLLLPLSRNMPVSVSARSTYLCIHFACWFFKKSYAYIFVSYISHLCGNCGAVSRYPPICNNCLQYSVSAMLVDGLATLGAKASTAMVLTKIGRHIPCSTRVWHF